MPGVPIRGTNLDMDMYREDCVKAQRKDGHWQAKGRYLRRNQSCLHLILDLYPPELLEDKFLLFNLLSLRYFVTPALTN